ncbi:MAG: DUF86 domain-containing protein [Candidatus Helarchaeota archaeon]
MNFIIEKMETIPVNNYTILEKEGIFYREIVSIEAAMDLIAMMLKDMGKTVSDDYSNIQNLMDLKIISKELANELRKCNGLRNVLVHRYNSIDDDLAINSISEIKTILSDLIKIVEDFLNEFGKNTQ